MKSKRKGGDQLSNLFRELGLGKGTKVKTFSMSGGKLRQTGGRKKAQTILPPTTASKKLEVFDLTLAEKEAKLINVKVELKKEFIGIDAVIDGLIDQIKNWIYYPELIDRPYIVCLWGMTGVGKTALVRRLIEMLEITAYTELNMNNMQYDGVAYRLVDCGQLKEDQPGILYIDEFHKFRSKNQKGEEFNEKEDMNDLWELLSDGSFANNNDRRLSAINRFNLFYVKSDKTLLKNTDFGDITSYVKYFNITEHSIEKLNNMPWAEVKRIFNEAYHANFNKLKSRYQYNNLLVIVSANLDEAFFKSKDIDNCDIDASLLNEMCSDITVNTIKKALLQRFLPEQIARLGNNHIIYKSFTEQNFKDLITYYVNRKASSYHAKANITINIDPTVKDYIYRNGVYPSQGARPVISCVNFVFNYIVEFVVKATKADVKTITVAMTPKNEMHILEHAEFGLLPVHAPIDDIRNLFTDDEKIRVSVHEAGHALIYSLVNGIIPIQIKINCASDEYNGFVQPHMGIHTIESMKDDLAMTYGGLVAEELVFGDENRSIGCGMDLEMISSAASAMIKQFAFGKNKMVFSRAPIDSFANETPETQKEIAELVEDAEKVCRKMMGKNKALLLEISKMLFDNNYTPDNYRALFKKYGIDVESKSYNHVISPDYIGKFNEQLAKLK